MSYPNGRFPAKALSRIPEGRLASGGPARSWLAMRYYIGRKSGVWLTPTGPSSSYRPIAKQQEFWSDYTNGRGPLAARPGTSNHGIGRAVDVPTGAMQGQIRRYGHLFGWGIAGGKLQSDAPSEQWHAKWVGPYGPRSRYWYGRYRLAKKGKR
jgi:hypothetical protein